MAQPYLRELRSIVEGERLRSPGAISCKHFFSGAAAYVGGDIFMTLVPAGLALNTKER